MKRSDRQQAILDLIVTQGEVELDALAERFAVSRMTIHRDLDELENSGLLRKVRGGATTPSGSRPESDFRLRERQDVEAKALMAEAALALIDPGMTVMINDGSMGAVLGRRCPEKRPLSVITNNHAVLDALRGEAGITLIALGGTYSQKYNAWLGKVCEDALRGLHADIAFISAHAVAGLETFHTDETVLRAKRAMMNAATTRSLLVNHSRFGQPALHRLAGLEEFDHIITDRAPNASARAALKAAGLTLTIADTANP